MKRNRRIYRTIKNAVFLSAWLLSFAGLNGCAAPLAVQGLSATSPVAFSHTGSGKGDSFWLAPYDDVVRATQRAGQALSLEPERKEIGEDQPVFHYVDGKGNQLDVLIERRTATMTYARFDVGLFGSKGMSRLMARQIVFEMTAAGAFLRNWHPAETNNSDW
jgi:hypothetical protein